MKKRKVLILIDASRDLEHLEVLQHLPLENWGSERALYRTLKNLGYFPVFFCLNRNFSRLVEILGDPDLYVVLNFCEAFRGNRKYESEVCGVLELMHVPYSGCSPFSLSLCKDKGLSKHIAHEAGISVPRFLRLTEQESTIEFRKRLSSWNEFPAVVKPLALEGSEGISAASVVWSSEELKERVLLLKKKWKTDCIVETFIAGKEYYVSVIEVEGSIKVLTPRVLHFSQKLPAERRIATFNAKWDEKYRERWKIYSKPASEIGNDQLRRLQISAAAAFKIFQMSGYGRMDFRVDKTGEVYFIEANPNPSLEPDDELALAARSMGIIYEELIETIIRSALLAAEKRSLEVFSASA